MIPTCEELVDAYRFLARRQRLEDRAILAGFSLPLLPHVPSIEAALRLTNRLIAERRHPATAFLYAFARYPKSFPLALNAMTMILAKNAAAKEGARLEVNAAEFRDVVMSIAAQSMTEEDAERWVRERLRPLDG